MNSFKQLIALFFLTFMLGMQLSALHHVTHDEDTTECEICLYSEQVTQLEWQPASTTVVVVKLPVDVERVDVEYYAFAKAESFTIYYPTRPPPVTS